MTAPPWASRTRVPSGTRARTSADVPTATIRSASIATAPSKKTSWSSFNVTTIASSISSIVASGWDDHAVQHVLERDVRLVQDLALVDRRELVVAVHDVAVDDRRVDGAPVARQRGVGVRVLLRAGKRGLEHLVVRVDQDPVALLPRRDLTGLVPQRRGTVAGRHPHHVGRLLQARVDL